MKNVDSGFNTLCGNTPAKPWLPGSAESDSSDGSLKRCCDVLALTSHEFRNPIAAMHGALSLINGNNFAAPGCEILPLMSLALQTMERQLEIQTRLASDLQDLVRFERGELDLHRESLDLLDLLKHTINDLRLQAEGLGLRLNLSLAESPAGLYGDPVRHLSKRIVSLQTPIPSKSMIDVSNQGAPAGVPAQVRRLLSNSLRILLVEDNADLATTMAMVLTRRGHNVLVCDFGHEALRHVINFRPQIVLLDIGLPGLVALHVAWPLAPRGEGKGIRPSRSCKCDS